MPFVSKVVILLSSSFRVSFCMYTLPDFWIVCVDYLAAKSAHPL